MNLFRETTLIIRVKSARGVVGVADGIIGGIEIDEVTWSRRSKCLLVGGTSQGNPFERRTSGSKCRNITDEFSSMASEGNIGVSCLSREAIHPVEIALVEVDKPRGEGNSREFLGGDRAKGVEEVLLVGVGVE